MKEEHIQLRKIARLYYVENMNQRQIADKMSISVAGVSRSITRAKDLGIVRISIDEDPTDYQDIEIELEKKYKLKECAVTSTAERVDNTYRAFALALAKLLSRITPRHAMIGVSWGETLKAIGEALDGVEMLQADVVPVIGAMGTVETGIYPNSIARTFADKLGGRSYLVNTPAVVDTRETAERIIADSTFTQVRELWKRIDIAILGTSGLGRGTSLVRQNIFAPSEIDTVIAGGAIAASNFLFFDSNGAVCTTSLSGRIVCLPAEYLRTVSNVIVVAGGEEKVGALDAVLRSGLVHTLITDVDTASSLRG